MALDPQVAELLGGGGTEASPPAAPLDPQVAALMQSATPHAAPGNGESLYDWAAALGSAAVRPVVHALSALPLLAMDTGVGLRNAVSAYAHGAPFTLADLNPFAKPAEPLPSQRFNAALDRFTRAPEGIGKIGEFVSTALAGAALPVPSALSGRAAAAPRGFVRGVSDQPGELPAQAEHAGLTAAQRAAARGGATLGMRLTPGEATQAKPLLQMEEWAKSHSWTSAPFARVARANQAAIDRAAAAAVGKNAPNLDAETLDAAEQRFTKGFAYFRRPDHVYVVDPKATADYLNHLDDEFADLLPNGKGIRESSALVRQLEKLTNSGGITAEQLGALTSKMGKAAANQLRSPNGDRQLGLALYNVKDHLDDIIESGLGPQERAAYAELRTQYRNFINLLSRTNIVNSSTGHVSGVALANRLQSADRAGFTFGRNQTPLYRAARFAQAFKPIVGDSGTATRSANPFNPFEAALGVPANLAMRAYLSAPGAALMRAGSGLGRGALTFGGGVARRAPHEVPLLALPYQRRGRLPSLVPSEPR